MFEQCHASLKRLDTEYIDLYQCHRYDEETPLVETCRAMNDLIDQGKILYWGVSEWTAEQISDAVATCDDNGWHLPVSNQPLYNMLERHWEGEVFPTCERLGLGDRELLAAGRRRADREVRDQHPCREPGREREDRSVDQDRA